MKPNFLIIVADDLGYTDLGCYGSEIKTPHLDRLAKEGVQFTDSMCSPTRSMLLSGTDNHIAGLGCLSELRAHNYENWDVRGYEGYLNFDVAALPELLQDNGYATMMSGKWHLGLTPETNPAARGFDRSFALLPGCSNHWGHEPQFTNNKERYMESIPVLYTEDGKQKDVQPNRTDNYEEGFYSSEYYAAKLLEYLREHYAKPDAKEQPFFAYLPFAAPHWPLQCSEEDRASYRGLYDNGPDALRDQRIRKLCELRIIDSDVVPHPVVNNGYPEWTVMDSEQRKRECRAMEVYAGMVQGIDRNVGRVVDYLERIGQLDNTFVLFMSDNGAEGAFIEAKPILGRTTMHNFIEKYYNNSIENMGNHDSFIWYGPRWAQASTAPSRLWKSFSTEGGIRVPCVARYPPLLKPGSESNLIRSFANATDIMPTVLELAGVQHPVALCQGRQTALHRGRTVVGMTGKSWVDFFSNAPDGNIYDPNFSFGWELHGHGCLRNGKWKIVYLHAGSPTSRGRWELFDIEKDPGETHDLAEEMPDKCKELQKLFDEYVENTGTVWMPDHKSKKEPKPEGWTLPEDSVGGNPETQRDRWFNDSALRGGTLPALTASVTNGV